MTILIPHYEKATLLLKKFMPVTNLKFTPIKYNPIEKNIENLTDSEYYLMSILESFKKDIDFDNLSWFKLDRQNLTIMTTYSAKWLEYYFKNDYRSDDEILNNSSNTFNPLLWSFLLGDELRQDLQHLSKTTSLYEYGLVSGITFPLFFDQHIKMGLSFSSIKPLEHFKKAINKKINDLRLISHVFHLLLQAHYEGDVSVEDDEVVSFYQKHLFY